MTRQLSVLLICLVAGPAFSQDLVVNTRLNSFQELDRGESVQLDLRDYFQTYASPGPVATFIIKMPVQNGYHRVKPDGTLDPEDLANDSRPQLMTYQLQGGGSYTDPYSVDPSDFVWEEHSVEFQLIPEEAPVSVANFMTYTNDGAYENTIVHRNESTGGVFRSGGLTSFNPLPIIQAGGFRLYEGDDYLLEWVPTRTPITFEETRPNTKGTLALARTALSLNSATSQFFVNLQDNTNAFGSSYAVFGELVNPEEDQPVLDTFAEVPIYDLTSAGANGNPNVFPTLPFNTIPLYTPIWDDKDSYSRISNVTIPEGGKDGISYSWEFVDTEDPEEGPTENEIANRASFDIQINGSEFIVNRNDTGAVRIEVTATNGSTSASFQTDVIAYNPAALDQFPSSTIYPGGWLENAWFGWVAAEDIPIITHLNHGYQYVDESSTPTVLYLYDFNLASWLYTTSSLYPNLYNFGLGKWTLYLEETGNGFTEERWFWVYDGDNSRWVRESEI
jgi:cyclophilin family peptidyl-prolyl cis-trans isomerase